MLTKELGVAIEAALQNKLQKRVSIKGQKQVFGGDINDAFVLETTTGKLFVKLNNASAGNMFEKESNGLQLLAQAQTISVPKTIVTGSTNSQIFFIMEYVEKSEPGSDFWQQFGHGLARLHKTTTGGFGLNEDNYIGTILQQNDACVTWAEFYTQRRIMPLMEKALQQHKCTINDVRAAEGLCKKFTQLFPEEPPALLHGDLWSGNFMVGDNGGPVIYDPAVYYGHREMDIAMTLLFGGFEKKFYSHYNEAYPLLPGWQQRVPLCQLYPLLVHLLLFGGHYYNSVMEIVKRY